MNSTHLVLWSGLLATALGAAPLQEQKEKKKSESSVTRFFEGEKDRLAEEIEGTWMLFQYTDPADLALEDQAGGFATFHDGFLTLVLAMETFDQGLLGLSDFLVLDSGLFRYRIDEMTNLQLAGVMSFTNQTVDGEMEREPSGQVAEYYTRLEDGVLELRDADGIVLSFRKIGSSDFPDSAIRKLDRRRSGTEQWEDER
jgi:hypothetical protein